ncbi:MAG: hypothetical protein RL447_812, partial [Bacteroidota bacterium]
IDEYDHRRIPHPANLHQSACLILHPIDAIDHQNNAIYRRECSVRILSKVLVTGRIEQVDECVFVFEAHDRGGNGDTPLTLDLHKIAGGMLLDLIAFHRPSHLNGPSEQEELFG